MSLPRLASGVIGRRAVVGSVSMPARETRLKGGEMDFDCPNSLVSAVTETGAVQGGECRIIHCMEKWAHQSSRS